MVNLYYITYLYYIFDVPTSTLRDRVKKVKDGLKDIESRGDKGL